MASAESYSQWGAGRGSDGDVDVALRCALHVVEANLSNQCDALRDIDLYVRGTPGTPGTPSIPGEQGSRPRAARCLTGCV